MTARDYGAIFLCWLPLLTLISCITAAVIWPNPTGEMDFPSDGYLIFVGASFLAWILFSLLSLPAVFLATSNAGRLWASAGVAVNYLIPMASFFSVALH